MCYEEPISLLRFSVHLKLFPVGSGEGIGHAKHPRLSASTQSQHLVFAMRNWWPTLRTTANKAVQNRPNRVGRPKVLERRGHNRLEIAIAAGMPCVEGKEWKLPDDTPK